MQTWLKLIGSAHRPLTRPEYQGRWEEPFIGFRKTGKPSFIPGDQVFLYAPGGTKSIFALAEAISHPEINEQYEPNEEGSCYWNVKVKYLINHPVDRGISIEEITTKDRNLSKSIQRQSHIRLSSEEAELAFHKLQKR